MAESSQVEDIAREIARTVSQEFPSVSVDIDLETPRDDHEDGYLWITPGTEDREEINEIWGFAIKLIQDAFQNHDVYLVGRMRGVGTILRDRPSDKE